MTGMCGWLGDDSPQHNNQKQLDRMSSLLLPRRTNSKSIILDNEALHISHNNANYHIGKTQGCYAAITGNPTWHDKDIKNISKERGPATALINAYLQHGSKFLSYISGSFSFAILQPDKSYALLAIDKLGIESLKYALLPRSGIIFASTNTAIVAHPEITQTIRNQSIYDYTFFHSIPSPDTIYKDIHKLKPSELVEYKNGKLKTSIYWRPKFNKSSNNPSIDDLKSNLHRSLKDSVKESINGNKSGSFLSGGLDSSTVTGVLSNCSSEECHAFSIGFSEPGYDEIEYARTAAKHFNATIHEYYVTPEDVLKAIPYIAQTYDEPFGNSSAIPTYFCAKIAKQSGVDVLLAGDGGDELFAGNTRYVKQSILEKYNLIPAVFRRHLIEKLFGSSEWPNTIPLLNKVNSYIRQASIPMPARMHSYNFLVRSNLKDIFTDDFLDDIDENYLFSNMENTYNLTDGDSLVNRMLHLDWKYTLADNDFRKVDVMCQNAGIEVKFPMVSDSLISLAEKVPESLKIKDQQLRYFFKYSMQGFLPDKIINKSKHGFGLPFGEWLKNSNALKELVNDNMNCLKNRDIFLSSFIENLIDTHRSGHASYYGNMIWVLLLYELWMQEHTKSV